MLRAALLGALVFAACSKHDDSPRPPPAPAAPVAPAAAPADAPSVAVDAGAIDAAVADAPPPDAAAAPAAKAVHASPPDHAAPASPSPATAGGNAMDSLRSVPALNDAAADESSALARCLSLGQAVSVVIHVKAGAGSVSFAGPVDAKVKRCIATEVRAHGWPHETGDVKLQITR